VDDLINKTKKLLGRRYVSPEQQGLEPHSAREHGEGRAHMDPITHPNAGAPTAARAHGAAE
jgi:hypothetical protein